MKPEKVNNLFLQVAWFAYVKASPRNTLDFDQWKIRHAAAILPELLKEGE